MDVVERPLLPMLVNNSTLVIAEWYIKEAGSLIKPIDDILMADPVSFFHASKHLKLPFSYNLAKQFICNVPVFFNYCAYHNIFPSDLLKEVETNPYFILRFSTEILGKRLPEMECHLEKSEKHRLEYYKFFKIESV